MINHAGLSIESFWSYFWFLGVHDQGRKLNLASDPSIWNFQEEISLYC